MFNAIRDFLLSIGYDKWILPTLLFLPAVGAILTWLHGIYEYRTRHFGRQYEAFARWLPFCIAGFGRRYRRVKAPSTTMTPISRTHA